MSEVLDELPVGFVVFHDVPLPKPSTATVDHIVVGPRSIWAVMAASFSDAVAAGTGRGADTLWAGRTPLRSLLEECESHADALARVVGYPVEPMLCLAAPSVPEPMFDFDGIRIATPAALAEAVGTTTTGWHDVAAVAAAFERMLAIEPARRTVMPTLGAATPPPTTLSSRNPLAGPARVAAAMRRHLPVRRVVPSVTIVCVLTLLPNVVGLGTSVAQRGVEVGVGSVTDVLTPSTLVSEAAGNDAPAIDTVAPIVDPPGVWYVVTCPEPGAGWSVGWVWPGALPAGAASYGVQTRSVDNGLQDRTPFGWAGPESAPLPTRLNTVSDVAVVTEYRDANGAVIASTEQPLRQPTGTC